ncbi:MAG: hypothetical protein ABI224_12665 [Acetobacteraceae bacterium]
MATPQTTLHYAPNANLVGNTYAPGVDGFNLADVSGVGGVNALPAGVKALVYLGYTGGNTAAFQSMVQPLVGNPKVFGFYLADEPGPDVSAANLKAESDYVHAVDPGAKTFIVLENNGDPINVSYGFNPANTDIDLFGLDPYPIRPQFAGGANYGVIGDAVNAAEAEGIPQSAIVPIYQAFGAASGPYASWTLPTPAQEQTILTTWGQYVPHPSFDYAYSWGTQDGDTALSTDPALQAVFAAQNAGSGGSPPPADVLTTKAATINATAGQSFSGTVVTFTDSNASILASGLTATINWGDGTKATAGVVSGAKGSFTVTGSHTYAAAGTDTVAVTLAEKSPGTATATADGTARVAAQPPPPTTTTMRVMDQKGTAASVPVVTSGSSRTAVGVGSVSQSVAAGVDTVSSAGISYEILRLGSGTVQMRFIGPSAVAVTGGTGTDTVTASSNNNGFIAGTGTLDVTGGPGSGQYVFPAGGGLLKVEDFAIGRDHIVIGKSLQGATHQASDGHGGTMLTVGAAGHGIDLVGVASLPASKITFS